MSRRSQSERRRAPPTGAGAVEVAGIVLSHPDRLIYPGLHLTKADLARYYQDLGDWIVPHVRGRPLTLVHCPAGVGAPCTYLRHAKAWGPSALRRVRIPEKTKVGEYLVADDVSGVVALAQMGVVEIHTWNSTADDLERPNRLVWDLDPGPEVVWRTIADAARLVRDVLRALGLRSWVKTTGGRGLHVVVPLVPALEWSACLAFARDVAAAIARADPRRLTTRFAKHGREDRILVDYLRNNRTNTSICAFAPRARPGAPVSLPIDWHELGRTAPAVTLPEVWRRFRRRRRDPWAEYWEAPQRVGEAAAAALRAL